MFCWRCRDGLGTTFGRFWDADGNSNADRPNLELSSSYWFKRQLGEQPQSPHRIQVPDYLLFAPSFHLLIRGGITEILRISSGLRAGDCAAWACFPQRPPAMPMTMTSPPTRLPPELAFVVQLQAPGPQAPDALAGRVEHIASGKTRLFGSLGELYEFMGQTLQPVTSRHRP